MTRQVLIVPDKFKGTLTALEAATAIAAGWREVFPTDHLELLPMSDGGDGFGPVVAGLLDAESRTTATIDAAKRPCSAAWYWSESKSCAILETAKVIGLAMLPKGQFHPFALDTFGLGNVFQDIAALGARQCIVGIGGSATNDGGFGLARSLGWIFQDRDGTPLLSWTSLVRLHSLSPPTPRPQFGEIFVAVDVANPLLGAEGCTRVYGPQKGLQPSEFADAEQALAQLAKVVQDTRSNTAYTLPGAGAAGGLGYGLAVFAGAKLVPGFNYFAQLTGLEEKIRTSNLVITGEGSIDASSLMGKGVGGVAQLCRTHGIPCIGLAGILSNSQYLTPYFHSLNSLAPDFVPTEEALRNPCQHLTSLARLAAQHYA